ncbi:hypothetical protein BHE74_00017564 [Ensete ventricosum]|nr:hypothetical protein BHE74_00017564 [Ensete ventricosum]
MRKRAASASAAAKSVAKGKSKGHDAFFTSPDPSSKPYHFDLPSFPTATAASCSLNTTPASYLRHPPSPPPSAKAMTTTLATISDLKALASSRTDSLKRHLDLCHSDILKDFDASNTRLSKRFKIVRAGSAPAVRKNRLTLSVSLPGVACAQQQPKKRRADAGWRLEVLGRFRGAIRRRWLPPDLCPALQFHLLHPFEVPENKRRISSMKGIVIARRNAGPNTTFRLRRLVSGVGVESVFPL